MDSINTSIWTNDSIFLLNVLNDSSDLTKNKTTQLVDSLSIALSLICGIGLPGNLFVIAVYMFKMTTSTRVYMFALAVADSAVCISGIVLTFAAPDFVIVLVFLCIIDVSATFSMFLLVFVSMERLIAVRRPHSFSADPQRAKKAMIIIVAAATLFTIVREVGHGMIYTRFIKVLEMVMLFSSTLIMVTCYTLMAIELLKKVRDSRNQVGVQSVTHSTVPETSESDVSTVADPGRSCNPGPSNVPTMDHANVQSDATKSKKVSATKKITATPTKTFKSVFLIFIVTVVFVVCWLPMWLIRMGVSMSPGVDRIFVLNSVVNPFIYGVVSGMFREDVRQFYRQTHVKLSACCH